MKRKHVKFMIGEQQLSIWRITFVNRLAPKIAFTMKDKVDLCFNTYFCFAPDLPSALNKLRSFCPKDEWDVFHFERFRTLDYDKIYKA